MNTSRPRTFSRNSTLTSPSLNRSTSARPSGTCKCLVISCASAGFALPVNTAIDNEPNPLFCDIDLAQNGWGGRIRTSVWRDQNPLPYRLATPQLDNQSSAHARRRRSTGRQPLKQGRVVQSARQECFESRRQLTRDVAAFGRLTGDENTGPRAGQAHRAEPREPIDRVSHLGISATHHSQAIVPGTGRQETVNCDGRRI